MLQQKNHYGLFAGLFALFLLVAAFKLWPEMIIPPAHGAELENSSDTMLVDSMYARRVAQRANDYDLTVDASRPPAVNKYGDWRADFRKPFDYDFGSTGVTYRGTKVIVKMKCYDLGCFKFWEWFKKQ